jgi:hypothetical protein
VLQQRDASHARAQARHKRRRLLLQHGGRTPLGVMARAQHRVRLEPAPEHSVRHGLAAERDDGTKCARQRSDRLGYGVNRRSVVHDQSRLAGVVAANRLKGVAQQADIQRVGHVGGDDEERGVCRH